MNKEKENSMKEEFRSVILSHASNIIEMRSKFEFLREIDNISIIYNNKISEILHYFYDRNVAFFTNDSVLKSAIYSYLSTNYQRGLEAFTKYTKRKSQKYLDTYYDSINIISRFDIENDLITVLEYYIEKELMSLSEYRTVLANDSVFFEHIIYTDLKERKRDDIIGVAHTIIEKNRRRIKNKK